MRLDKILESPLSVESNQRELNGRKKLSITAKGYLDQSRSPEVVICDWVVQSGRDIGSISSRFGSLVVYLPHNYGWKFSPAATRSFRVHQNVEFIRPLTITGRKTTPYSTSERKCFVKNNTPENLKIIFLFVTSCTHERRRAGEVLWLILHDLHHKRYFNCHQSRIDWHYKSTAFTDGLSNSAHVQLSYQETSGLFDKDEKLWPRLYIF